MCASIVISIVLTDYFMLYMMERFNYLVQKQYEDAMYKEEMHYKDIYYEEAEKQNKEVQKLKHDMKMCIRDSFCYLRRYDKNQWFKTKFNYIECGKETKRKIIEKA